MKLYFSLAAQVCAAFLGSFWLVNDVDGFHFNFMLPGCCKYNYRAAAGCRVYPSHECVLEREGKKN